MKLGRKEFFVSATAFFVSFFVGKKASTSQLEESKKTDDYLWGMVIDMDKCTACESCIVACSVENNMMIGKPEEATSGRLIR